ncbi:MAG: diaminopimelate epimerase [Bacteroidales bacterium]
MTTDFYKFHGAGNDFILADNRQGAFSHSGLMNQAGIAGLCDRHKGIGADGLMLLEPDPDTDFKMLYFNSDGLPGTMCGNGGRCMVAFARLLGIIKESTRFMASDGIHHAHILKSANPEWTIALKMIDTSPPIKTGEGYQVDTGSPHLVIFTQDVEAIDVIARGRHIRHSPAFAPKGINVNFVQVIDEDTLKIRTYERGVEHETMACGTGAVAAALAARGHGIINADNNYQVKAAGGDLQVSYTPASHTDTLTRNITLTGPARIVFSGKLNL